MEGLTSLAILKVNWDERQQDYLDNFIPFVQEALRRSEADEVSSTALKDDLKDLVGFEIPHGVVRILLDRMVGEGVRRVNNTYYRDLDSLNGTNLEPKAQSFQRRTATLVGKVCRFAEENWGLSWTEDEAEKLLLNYLSRLSAPLLHSARFGSDAPGPKKGDGKADYILSAFVNRCLERDEEGFQYLVSIAKGCMMASVVYYEDPNAAVQQFDDVTFYLDTPFLLDALGINGEDLREARKELIDLLLEANGDVRVFEDTVDEMRGVIDGEARRSQSERTQRIPTSGNPIQSSLSSSDLRLLSEKLEDRLKNMRIWIEEKPDFENWLSLDEGSLRDRLIAAGYNENKVDTIRHDVEALMAVHRLRKGRAPGRLENCKAVFVTTNPTLVRVGKEFFADQIGNRARDAPPCVQHDDLATRVWLKSPNDAPDLPRKQLLAHSYAALLPDDDVLDAYLRKIDEMKEAGRIERDDYLYLRSLKNVGHEVADMTLNDAEVFTEADVEEIRERKEAQARADAEKEASEQRERAERKDEQARKERQRRQREEERRQKQEEIASRERSEKREERVKREKYEKRIHALARTVKIWTERITWFLSFVSFVAGFWIAQPELPPSESSNVNRILVGAILVLAGVGSLINALVTSNSVAKWVGDCAEHVVLAVLTPSDGD